MRAPRTQPDSRRSGLSGLGAMSLFLAAVIVLTSTPAVLAGQLNDPTHPISRMGSQLRRIAAVMPVRLVAKQVRRDEHRPFAAHLPHGRPGDTPAPRCALLSLSGTGPTLAHLSVLLTDLPPPGAPRSI
jgi:hypothetical protein